MSPDYHTLDNESYGNDNYECWPMNMTHSGGAHSLRSQSFARNMTGTIKWAQCLRQAPTLW